MSVESVVNLMFQGIHKDTTDEIKQAVHQLSLSEKRKDGSGTGQVDAVYSDLSLDLAASIVTLDLQSLTDSFGAALSLQRLFWFAVQNTSTTAGDDLKIGGSGTNPFDPFAGAINDLVLVPPNGWFVWGDTDGETVDGANKNIQLNPGTKTFTIKVFILGTKS